MLFYIAGGGYKTLPTTNFNFDQFINNSDGSVIVVQISYRVGALGFLAGSRVQDGGDLNVGLLDQRKVRMESCPANVSYQHTDYNTYIGPKVGQEVHS